MLAKDGREGLEKLRLLNGPVHDYIFIDLNMPRMNGIETLAEINKMSFLNNTRITIYSTTSNQSIIDDAMEKGADGFLVKPESIKELVQKLRKIFDHQTIG
jgi:CheY-like chemotaxis protein